LHTVAQRIGDDSAVLLRNYAKRKRTKQADQNIASAIAVFSVGVPADCVLGGVSTEMKR
jgi:integrase